MKNVFYLDSRSLEAFYDVFAQVMERLFNVKIVLPYQTQENNMPRKIDAKKS